MNNTALIIYDENGRVWSVQIGVNSNPNGIDSFVSAVPAEFDTITIDVANKTPHFYLNGVEVFAENV